MTKEQLETMAERYQKRADRNMQYFQESGTQRYLTEYNRFDDIAQACRQAAYSADEHNRYIYLSSEIGQLKGKAKQLLDLGSPDPQEMERLLRNLAAI